MTEQQQRDGMSRRGLLRGAGIAAAGAVVGAAVPLTVAEFGETRAAGAPELPVMVHLRDARSGSFDVFVGTRRVEMTDRAFAARLADLATH
jgi:hypothetical protein